MPDRRRIKSAVVLASLSTLVVVGVAGGQSMMKIGTGDPIADRQRLMKLNGANWQDAQAKAKAGNIEAIAVNAETIAINAGHIPALFPKGSLTDKSKAKPEIWEKWSEFESAVEEPRDAGPRSFATRRRARTPRPPRR